MVDSTPADRRAQALPVQPLPDWAYGLLERNAAYHAGRRPNACGYRHCRRDAVKVRPARSGFFVIYCDEHHQQANRLFDERTKR